MKTMGDLSFCINLCSVVPFGGDAFEFWKDLDRWSAALETAWDEEVGHYSYIEHDAEGIFSDPTGMRAERILTVDLTESARWWRAVYLRIEKSI